MNRWKSFESRFGNAGSAPGFEMWFAVVIDARSKVALWLRYTTFTPQPKTGGVPVAIVWASFFDAEHPENHCFAAETYELEHARFGKTTVSFPRALFSPGKLEGSVQTDKGELGWTLKLMHRFDARERVPWNWARRLARSEGTVVSPFADFKGDIACGDKTINVDGARGTLGHVWGTRRVDQMVWTMVPAFDNDLDETAVEVLSLKPGGLSPQLCMATLVYQGRVYTQSSLWQCIRGETAVEYPFLRFRPRLGHVDLSVNGRVNPEQTTHFLYKNPDGTERYVSHCDISDVNCFVERAGQRRELNARCGGAMEFHGGAPWADAEYLNPFGID